MIEQIRNFHDFLVELGVARNVLALPAPKTLLIEDHTSQGDDGTAVFSRVIDEKEIVDVARDLFASGHYNIAVAEAYKALDKFVQTKAGSISSGTSMMREAFSTKSPKLFWTERVSASEKDEHEGYGHLFAGAMLGIRNPTTHEFNWISDGKTALELLIFAQHLLRKAKIAQMGE